jgi:uncharacterized protein (TIGR02001 family)
MSVKMTIAAPSFLGWLLRRLTAGALATAAVLMLPAPQAGAFELEDAGLTVTATPALVTDYLFRGISQTRNRPAGQLTLDVQHETGLYVGTFVSNVAFLAEPSNNSRFETDILAGYRREIMGVAFDIGYIAYLYPGQDKLRDPGGPFGLLNEYQEIMLKGTYTWDIAKFMGTYTWSPNYFGQSGTGNYLEAGVDLSLPYEFTLFGRASHQWIARNAVFGVRDYSWFAVGLSREIAYGVIASLGFYTTDLAKESCVALPNRAPLGQHICAPRALVSLSATF